MNNSVCQQTPSVERHKKRVWIRLILRVLLVTSPVSDKASTSVLMKPHLTIIMISRVGEYANCSSVCGLLRHMTRAKPSRFYWQEPPWLQLLILHCCTQWQPSWFHWNLANVNSSFLVRRAFGVGANPVAGFKCHGSVTMGTVRNSRSPNAIWTVGAGCLDCVQLIWREDYTKLLANIRGLWSIISFLNR